MHRERFKLFERRMERPSKFISHSAANLVGLSTKFVNPGELETMITLVNSRFQLGPRSFLEIGTNSGRTSLAILRNCPLVTTAWGIDVPPDYARETLLAAQRKEVPSHPGSIGLSHPGYRLLIAPQGSRSVDKFELPSFDVIFIDGDHSKAGVIADYALARSVLRGGKGLIMFHDDNGLPVVEVSQALDELVKEGSNIIHATGTWLAYEVIE